jgi:hypothetical protein
MVEHDWTHFAEEPHKWVATQQNNRSADNYVAIKTRLPSWIERLDGSKYCSPDDILKGRKYGDVFATLKAQYQAGRNVPSGAYHLPFPRIDQHWTFR